MLKLVILFEVWCYLKYHKMPITVKRNNAPKYAYTCND